MDNFSIPIFRPQLPTFKHLEPWIKKIDDNRWYTNYGPLTQLLEFELAAYFGLNSKQIVTLSSGTTALEGALSTHSYTHWDLPSWTFAATATSVLRSGKNAKFIDVSLDSWRVSPDANVSAKNYGIIDVLPFGDELDFARHQLAENQNRTILFDGAASFHSLKNFGSNLPKYEFGLILSLHATKAFPAGEGGVFISNNTDWVKRVRKWGNFGFNDNRESDIVGTNAKMSEYCAAVGLASLTLWEDNLVLWKDHLEWMKKIANKFSLNLYPAARKNFISPYFIVESEPGLILAIEKSFINERIQVRKWWGNGCHEQRAFVDIPRENLKNTKTLSETTLGLPYFIDIEESQKLLIEKKLALIFPN